MAHAIYQHDFASVNLSPEEADRLQVWEQVLRHPCGVPSEALTGIKRKHDLKMADIEKVARWKFERGR